MTATAQVPSARGRQPRRVDYGRIGAPRERHQPPTDAAVVGARVLGARAVTGLARDPQLGDRAGERPRATARPGLGATLWQKMQFSFRRVTWQSNAPPPKRGVGIAPSCGWLRVLGGTPVTHAHGSAGAEGGGRASHLHAKVVGIPRQESPVHVKPPPLLHVKRDRQPPQGTADLGQVLLISVRPDRADHDGVDGRAHRAWGAAGRRRRRDARGPKGHVKRPAPSRLMRADTPSYSEGDAREIPGDALGVLGTTSTVMVRWNVRDQDDPSERWQRAQAAEPTNATPCRSRVRPRSPVRIRRTASAAQAAATTATKPNATTSRRRRPRGAGGPWFDDATTKASYDPIGNSSIAGPPIHPGWPRCSSSTYVETTRRRALPSGRLDDRSINQFPIGSLAPPPGMPRGFCRDAVVPCQGGRRSLTMSHGTPTRPGPTITLTVTAAAAGPPIRPGTLRPVQPLLRLRRRQPPRPAAAQLPGRRARRAGGGVSPRRPTTWRSTGS